MGEGLASATCTVKPKSPFTVGVPLITPVLLLSVTPSGSLPLVTVQVLLPDPPSDARVCEYTLPRTTAGSP